MVRERMEASWLWMILLICIGCYAVEETSIRPVTTAGAGFRRKLTGTPMHKVLLTQRGYIQFLRWQLPVPEINEFTFCLWVKSMNLTYPHSIFSYSKNEKERLVRAWIAPFGRSIHLEINNIEILSEPTFILENQWYHICQSWDNREGRYGLWVDGQNKVNNIYPEMAGYVIPSNGDIVLGQEYTDFDKGLEEGIEGAVLGFNLLLASAFNAGTAFEDNGLDDDPLTAAAINFPKFPASPVTKDITSGRLHSVHLNYPASARYSRKPTIPEPLVIRIRKARQISIIPTRIGRENSQRLRSSPIGGTPLGLRLIETGYYHCQEGRGSPYLGRSNLLISWTRTPVRIFGGALIKNVDGQCGLFNTLR